MNAFYRIAAVLCSALYAAQAMCAAAPPAHRTLVPDDFYRVQDVSDPQVSPDGARVLYTVGPTARGWRTS